MSCARVKSLLDQRDVGRLGANVTCHCLYLSVGLSRLARVMAREGWREGLAFGRVTRGTLGNFFFPFGM